MRTPRTAVIARTFMVVLSFTWVALCSAIHQSPSAMAADDFHAIRTLIGSTWDQPGRKVETDPIVVSGQYAVASWTQGDHGGRALLRRDGHDWKVVLCSGDPLTRAASLIEAGVPKPDADVIAQRLTDDEARAPADRRAKFSLVEGTVMGDAPAHHHEHIQDHSPPLLTEVTVHDALIEIRGPRRCIVCSAGHGSRNRACRS